jgi:signal transduction histidine kinase
VAERTEELTATNKQLEAFVYSIAHDLRAPLRAMQGFAKMLSQESLDCLRPSSMELIRKIIAAAERMDKLVQDSLDYSKILRSEFTLQPVDPLALLRGIIESYPQFASSNATISFHGDFPRVLADEAPLSQCFSNILANAIKFVPAGTAPEVKIWSEVRDGRVRLFFQDNGIGIPREAQQRIFDMFQRLDKGYEGTGIGLAIVRKIVERMDGAVGVESEPGKGSRFWLELASAAAPNDLQK